MPNTRNMELKNQMIRMQQEVIYDTRKLLDQALHFNEYAIRSQKRYDELDKQNALLRYRLNKYREAFGEYEPSPRDKNGNFYGKSKN